MTPLRWWVCLMVFCVDVHVRADELGNCWGKSTPCPIKAAGTRQILSSEGLKISVAAGAMIERRDSKTIQLIAGQFLVVTEVPVVFQTPYARIWCLNECRALFEREATEVAVKSLSGNWRVQRKGEEQIYALAPGLQLRIGEVEPNGFARMEFPESLPWSSTVKQWGGLFAGDSAEFKNQVGEFRAVWQEAVNAVTDLHQTTARREIASFESKQSEERARQKARAAEDQSLRALFRQKNDLNP